jgi:nitroreductase
MGQGSATIALTYLELAAFGFGMGGCWAGYFNAAAQAYPKMIEALGLPEGHACMGAMMLGYSQVKYQRIPLRNEPKVSFRS